MDNISRSAIIGTGSNLLREESSGSEDGSHDIHSVQFYLGSSPPSISPSVPSISQTANIPTRVTSSAAATATATSSISITTTTVSGNTIETVQSPVLSTNTTTTTTTAANINLGNLSYTTNDR